MATRLYSYKAEAMGGRRRLHYGFRAEQLRPRRMPGRHWRVHAGQMQGHRQLCRTNSPLCCPSWWCNQGSIGVGLRICSRRRLQGTRLRSRGGRSRRSKRKISLPTSHATSGDGECGTWQTVGGTHRWEAARRAGWTAARKSRDGVGPWCAGPALVCGYVVLD